MHNILLSIIVPVYNVAEYVEKCIKSIILQDYSYLDIIIVDDGSTDKSGEICDKYAMEDKRIKVFHKKNGGLVSARKYGALKAKGEYIVAVDGDDWIEKDRLKKLVNDIGDKRPDMIYMSGYYRDNIGGRSELNDMQYIQGEYIGEGIYDYFLLDTNSHFYDPKFEMALWTWAIKKDIYIESQMKIDDEISLGEDSACLLSCILKSRYIMCTLNSGYHYVRRGHSLIAAANNNYKYKLKKLFHQLNQIIDITDEESEISKITLVHIFFLVFFSDYESLGNHGNSLFGYPGVSMDKKIIVYGAGNYGKRIAKTILDCSKDSLIAWIDKNESINSFYNYKIQSPSIINDYDYDYIVIAIIRWNSANSAKQELVELGVPEEKIILIDSNCLKYENLPEYLRG